MCVALAQIELRVPVDWRCFEKKGGDVWEADGIWKEIDGGVTLLNDIEPSIGQQLMAEVRPKLHSTPFPNCCKVALASFSTLRTHLCVMWIAR